MALKKKGTPTVIEIVKICKCGHKEDSHFTWMDYGYYDYTCRNVTCKCKKFSNKNKS